MIRGEEGGAVGNGCKPYSSGGVEASEKAWWPGVKKNWIVAYRVTRGDQDPFASSESRYTGTQIPTS